jgi:hypothetical protein
MISPLSAGCKSYLLHFFKFVKIKCNNCGHLNLLPVYKRLTIKEPAKCEKCKEVIAKRRRISRTIFFYGDTVIP